MSAAADLNIHAFSLKRWQLSGSPEDELLQEQAVVCCRQPLNLTGRYSLVVTSIRKSLRLLKSYLSSNVHSFGSINNSSLKAENGRVDCQ